MRISTEIRNRRMMGFLLKGKPPKEVARRFNITVWAVYKAQKEMEKALPVPFTARHRDFLTEK